MAKIIICDDDPAFSSLISAFLTGEGHQVSVVSEPGHFPRAYQAFGPELLILDNLMPGGGSEMVLKFLGNRGELGKIPVIFCSATTGAEMLKKMPPFLRCDFFQKPVDPRKLKERIALFLAPRDPP